MTLSPLATTEQKTNDEREPFCSHDCLLKIVRNEESSINHCPNHTAHGDQSLSHDRFLGLLGCQLQGDEPIGLTSLGMSGRTGPDFRDWSPFSCKRLPTRRPRLQNELAAYERLRALQGEFIPVCCGAVDLPKAYNTTESRAVQHLLLLSWAGETLNARGSVIDQFGIDFSSLEPQLLSGLEQMHEKQVVHGDAERRNMIFDRGSQRLMMVDFERSRLYDNRPPCDSTKSCQKQRRDKKGRRKPCMYCRELRVAKEALLVGSPYSTSDNTREATAITSVDANTSSALGAPELDEEDDKEERISLSKERTLGNKPKAVQTRSDVYKRKTRGNQSDLEEHHDLSIWNGRLRRKIV
ncbi:hypothetical protein D6C81_03044 [Aureobasidium pullulans]|nr:hypothetical protein D6C81_03044 [Aureobasidium pullulans]